MLKTITDAKEWADKQSDKLDRDRLECPDPAVQWINKMIPEKSKELWNSGCWLAHVLREHGANDEQVIDIQTAQGQRSLGNDPWKVAVDYANEFIANGDTEEKSGIELAMKINNELFGEK